MAKAANTKLIGAFVLAGIALVVAAVIVFGGGRLFRATKNYSMFFTTSVQGLNVGAPVMFRGVPVGRVTDIDLLFNPEQPLFVTQVDVELFPESYHLVGQTHGSPHLEFERLIEAGLRAQLVPVSLVTGQLGIGLDLFPGSPAERFAEVIRAIAPEPVFAEIPTIPSTIERLETSLQRILAVIDKADFEALSKQIEEMLNAVSAIVTMPELREMVINANTAVGNANATVTQINQLLTRVDREIVPAIASLRATMANADATMADARKVMPNVERNLAQVGPVLDKLAGAVTIAQSLLENLNRTIEPGSPLQYEIANSLRELTLTLRAVRGLADALEQSPNSVLFGRMSRGQP